MSYKLSKSSLKRALNYLAKYGDTDIFPTLYEINFARVAVDEICDALSEVNILAFEPAGAFEALAPKSRYGFRVSHQLPLLDNIFLLAAVIEIGALIEAKRRPPDEKAAFSYRFDQSSSNGIFLKDFAYRDWLQHQVETLASNLKFKRVVATDISDFYARVNFHRLENLLDTVAPHHGAARYIKKAIKSIRAKQSFGLPVGGAAARILAELALVDIDNLLSQRGIAFTRFVDDFRLFLDERQRPYDVLALLGDALGITEGLSLNSSKTKVIERTQYLRELRAASNDVLDEAEANALENLTADIYFDDGEDPDPEDLEALSNLELLQMLKESLGGDELDFGRVKVIFRALKIVRPHEAVEFVRSNISELAIFAREVALLMAALDEEWEGCFADMADELVDLCLAEPASAVDLIRYWLLELFVRGIVPVDYRHLVRLGGLSDPISQRQLILMKARAGDVHFFRKGKSSFVSLNQAELPVFIVGSTCLPRDEFMNMNVPTITSFGPLSSTFISWVRKNRETALDLFTVRNHED